MSDQRLEFLEQRVTAIDHTINAKLDNMAEALSTLVRIEERQIQANERLSSGAQSLREHDLRLRELETSVPGGLDKRLSTIEVGMPGLLESRKWVVGGVLFGASMIGTALVALVFK